MTRRRKTRRMRRTRRKTMILMRMPMGMRATRTTSSVTRSRMSRGTPPLHLNPKPTRERMPATTSTITTASNLAAPTNTLNKTTRRAALLSSLHSNSSPNHRPHRPLTSSSSKISRSSGAKPSRTRITSRADCTST